MEAEFGPTRRGLLTILRRSRKPYTVTPRYRCNVLQFKLRWPSKIKGEFLSRPVSHQISERVRYLVLSLRSRPSPRSDRGSISITSAFSTA